MKLRILILAVALIPSALYAQDKPVDDKAKVMQLEAEVKQLKDTVATDAILISNLRMSVLQSQAGQVSAEKQKAIADLQAAHPGMRWDETSGKMVPIPPPAKPEAPKK